MNIILYITFVFLHFLYVEARSHKKPEVYQIWDNDLDRGVKNKIENNMEQEDQNFNGLLKRFDGKTKFVVTDDGNVVGEPFDVHNSKESYKAIPTYKDPVKPDYESFTPYTRPKPFDYDLY